MHSQICLHIEHPYNNKKTTYKRTYEQKKIILNIYSSKQTENSFNGRFHSLSVCESEPQVKNIDAALRKITQLATNMLKQSCSVTKPHNTQPALQYKLFRSAAVMHAGGLGARRGRARPAVLRPPPLSRGWGEGRVRVGAVGASPADRGRGRVSHWATARC